MTPSSLREESDVIELTEETYDAGVGDLDDFDIPEFKVPTSHSGEHAAAPAQAAEPEPASAPAADPITDAATQRLDASELEFEGMLDEFDDPGAETLPPVTDEQAAFIDFDEPVDTSAPEHTDDPETHVDPETDDELDALLDDDLTQSDVDDIVDHSVTQEVSAVRAEGRTDDLAEALAADRERAEAAGDEDEGGDDEDEFDRQQMVRTIQMQAVDRSQIERAMAIERLNLSEDLGDHRFAPDVIVSPPRVLTKQWREGSPVKPASRPPQVTGQAPKIPRADAAPSQPPPSPAASRAPSGQQSRVTQQQPKAVPKPKPADAPSGEMDGLVAELLEENKPKKQERRPAETVQKKKLGPRDTWFQTVFNEEYFRTIPPGMETQTRREVDFIIKSLSLEKGARILDLACGFGRHSIEITQRGYELAGLDLSMVMLKRALAAAQRQSLSIKFIHGDMRKLNFEQIFDGCYLWQSSFGYFDDKTNFVVLKGVWRALKPGGRFLLEVLNRDHIVQQMPARSWWEGKDCVFLEEVDFEPSSSVLHTKRSFIYEDGTPPLEQNSFIRLYSLHELTNLLHGAGFRVLEISGEIHHRGRFLGPQNSRLIVLAERK
jgi:SAM-dependent methyltransferase